MPCTSRLALAEKSQIRSRDVLMSQHFLLSAAARSLSVAKVMRMSEPQVETVFRRLRWPGTEGEPVCPGCGCGTCYGSRRRTGQLRWRCKACRGDFSITSGTLFAWHKLALRTYLLAIVLFCNEVKGKSMLALARDLDVQYKTAFVLAHKLREAMASSVKGLRIGGEGREAEIDGAYCGGHVRPENRAADRIDRRLAENQSGKRRVVVVMRERGGRTLAQVFPGEEDAVPTIRQRIARGTVVHADESPAWNPLHARFAMQRINHQSGYAIDGACTNAAESYFSRLRRAELGHHHHIAGPYLVRYAREAPWREDLRRVSNGEQTHAVVREAMVCPPSIDFRGYWQRAHAA
jgi:transposase-like protein